MHFVGRIRMNIVIIFMRYRTRYYVFSRKVKKPRKKCNIEIRLICYQYFTLSLKTFCVSASHAIFTQKHELIHKPTQTSFPAFCKKQVVDSCLAVNDVYCMSADPTLMNSTIVAQSILRVYVPVVPVVLASCYFRVIPCMKRMREAHVSCV